MQLNQLEEKSIYLLREAFCCFGSRMAMLWSVGKDSTVMLHLVKKAFFGEIPFPLIHVDTSFKIPEMLTFRDETVKELRLDMIVGKNSQALNSLQSFPDGTLTRTDCCQQLKTFALVNTAEALLPRERFNHTTQRYETDTQNEKFKALVMGIRADEEGSRSKERYFSVRAKDSNWNIEDMPPELWNEFNVAEQPGESIRIHPLLDWSELNIWQYIAREKIKVSNLYFDSGTGTRYRSLGCAPCTAPIVSKSATVMEIVQELSVGDLSKTSERAGRAQDKESGNSLEVLRRKGYM